MRSDSKMYQLMYQRIPKVIRDKDMLEIATGPGLLAKHVAGAAHTMIATDYSEGMIKEAKKGSYPDNQEKGILIAPNFVNHRSGFISRLWSGILKIVGISFEHQWTTEEYCAFLEKYGWKIKNCREMKARNSLVYGECVRKAKPTGKAMKIRID